MAFDAFLKIDSIKGESTDDKHKEWIEVLSFNTGIAQPSSGSASSGGGRTAQRANFGPFSFVKTVDKATPKLALFCANGEHIKEITLELCRASGDKQKYMEVKLYDSVVSSFTSSGSSKGGEPLPLEDVSFSYGKIDWTYTETDHATGKPKGDVKTNWDLKANKGG